MEIPGLMKRLLGLRTQLDDELLDERRHNVARVKELLDQQARLSEIMAEEARRAERNLRR